jgi:hypothetical protein
LFKPGLSRYISSGLYCLAPGKTRSSRRMSRIGPKWSLSSGGARISSARYSRYWRAHPARGHRNRTDHGARSRHGQPEYDRRNAAALRGLFIRLLSLLFSGKNVKSRRCKYLARDRILFSYKQPYNDQSTTAGSMTTNLAPFEWSPGTRSSAQNLPL